MNQDNNDETGLILARSYVFNLSKIGLARFDSWKRYTDTLDHLPA